MSKFYHYKQWEYVKITLLTFTDPVVDKHIPREHGVDVWDPGILNASHPISNPCNVQAGKFQISILIHIIHII